VDQAHQFGLSKRELEKVTKEKSLMGVLAQGAMTDAQYEKERAAGAAKIAQDSVGPSQ